MYFVTNSVVLTMWISLFCNAFMEKRNKQRNFCTVIWLRVSELELSLLSIYFPSLKNYAFKTSEWTQQYHLLTHLEEVTCRGLLTFPE